MSLNWTMLSPDRSPIPLPDELIIRTIDSGAELSLTIPDAPPSRSSTSGGSGGAKKLKEVGRLWLTDQRLIFIADLPKGSAKPSFESISIPLTALLSTKFEQPFLGANYLGLEIRPVPEGGLTDGTKAEIRLKDKGIFEFASSLDKTRERAIYMKRQQVEEEDSLPTYTAPPSGPGPSSSSSGPVYDDLPPGYDA
ncbi:unnamed protein product [Somion occarium]|uniref:Uncharacterized protein n=1 Tax=Somion occarium TaxID=3059160 RepID=A0ABP1CWQ0_9APHY